MNIATLIEIVEEAGASLSRSVRRYWPVNGRNEVGERNQTMHLAGALLRHEWHCWAEAHSDGATDRRHDLLAWHERTRTLCMIEAKRLYSPNGAAAIAADVQRIASFCPIAHGGSDGLSPERYFGLITATTWTQKIKDWWQSEVGRSDPWPAGTAAWPDARNRIIKAANDGEWRAISLGTESDRNKVDQHYLLYALWPITIT
jgi:hypothetical protein